MKNKGGRPKKEVADLRIKNVMVSFSVNEWETVQGLMDKTGHDTPAVFLRASGLRSILPAKVFVPEIHKRLHDRIIDGVNAIKDMRKAGSMDEYSAGEFLVNLRSIADDLMNSAAYKKIEFMQMEIDRLNRIVAAKEGAQ